MKQIQKSLKGLFLAAAFLLPILGFSHASAEVDYKRPLIVQGILELREGQLFVNKVRLDFGEDRVQPDRKPAEYYEKLIGSFVVIRGFEDTESQNFYLLHVYEVNGWGYPNPNIRQN